MSEEDRSDAPGAVQPTAAGEGWRCWLRGVEDLLTSLVLAALVLLPLGEVVLRKLFRTGVSGATAFQQHLTLLVGLLGGMLAARERRLLALSTVTTFLKGRWQVFACIFSSSFAAGISVFLCVAAAQLVQAEKEAGKILAYGIPLWTIQLVMPVGFGIIALRVLWRAAESCPGGWSDCCWPVPWSGRDCSRRSRLTSWSRPRCWRCSWPSSLGRRSLSCWAARR